PEARGGFSIPNLDTWILDPDHQATVLHHLLVLVVDWCRHGAPTATDVPQMRQFTRWAQYLGGFLAHHGVPGFLTNHTQAVDLDDDANEWRAFFLHWHHLHADRALTAEQLRRTAEPDAGPDPWAGTFPTTETGRLLSAKSLGRRLTGQIGRWRGDIVLRSATDTHKNVRTYWVEHGQPDNQTRKPANPQNPP
ncbi:MAG TPA: hypothetical protein VFO68_05390, partial [Actinophytocola sp.]|nr:hypothetical protein [Actinophytocola sp.]